MSNEGTDLMPDFDIRRCPSLRKCITIDYVVADELFDLDQLDDDDPFEVDHQAAHLFKHDRYGLDDVYDLWDSRPLFYPAVPPAHWLMVAEIAGEVLVVPLAPLDPAT
jgi:hypothetical protein